MRVGRVRKIPELFRGANAWRAPHGALARVKHKGESCLSLPVFRFKEDGRHDQQRWIDAEKGDIGMGERKNY